jgi:hypothetical protein
MHGVRAAIPRSNPLAKCEFATIRERLIKIGTRVIEHLARIRVQLPTSCPDAALFCCVALGFMPSGPIGRGALRAPCRAAEMADQLPTRRTASCLTPIPPDGTSARVSSHDLQKKRRVVHDPGYEPAAHRLLIIDRLERVARGEIDRLALFMPPGNMKSTYSREQLRHDPSP